MDKILTATEWLKENLFEKDRPHDNVTPMLMRQYAAYYAREAIKWVISDKNKLPYHSIQTNSIARDIANMLFDQFINDQKKK